MHRCTATLVPYRSFTPPNEILCGDFQAEFKITGIAMPDLQYLISPNLCQNAMVRYMVRYASSSMSFVCKQWKNWQNLIGQRVQLFKDYYPILPTQKTLSTKNQTDVLVETENISPTSREYSGACRQNYEETSSTEDQNNMQDQDIVQEHIQERMEPENKINSCKLYIKVWQIWIKA